jgi:flagellar protein FlgJ
MISGISYFNNPRDLIERKLPITENGVSRAAEQRQGGSFSEILNGQLKGRDIQKLPGASEKSARLLSARNKVKTPTEVKDLRHPGQVKDPKMEDKKLMEVAEEVESIFVNMLFKEMRKSVGKHKLIDGGMAEDIFQDMLYDEYSKITASNTKLGLAEMLFDEFKRQSR